MSALLALVELSPLVNVVGLDLKKGLMTVDISDLPEVPMARRVGLLAYTADAKAAIADAGQAVTLPGAFGPGKRVRFHGCSNKLTLEISDVLGNEDSMGQYLFLPKGWEPSWWTPGRWTLQQRRVDSNGKRWHHSHQSDFVVDNFGDLVEVPE